MRSTKIKKNFCSSSLCTCLHHHHMVILRSQNKITDFFMILGWASPFKWSVMGQTMLITIQNSPSTFFTHVTMSAFTLTFWHYTCIFYEIRLYLFTLILSARGPFVDVRFWRIKLTHKADVCRRQILTYKDGPRTEITQIFLTVVDPKHRYSNEAESKTFFIISNWK